MKVVTVGGHLTPALALIDHTKHHQLGVQWWFLGRLFSRAGQEAVESQEIKKRAVPFIPFDAPKLAGRVWQWPWLIPQLLWAVGVATAHLQRIKPDLVVVFGGYLAVPVVVAAKFLRIKIIAHEQTMIAGWANQIIGRLADQVAVTFPESRSQFPDTKTSVIGNAVRPAALKTDLPKPTWYVNDRNLPILVVTGGSQGSQAINQVVAGALPELVKNWYIVHQVGNPDGSAGDQTLKTLHQYAENSDNYVCASWLSAEDLFWLLRHDARVISRSGANTIYELVLLRVPAILIPLPIAMNGEQQAHAAWMTEQGGALTLVQSELTPQVLLTTLQKLHDRYQAMQAALCKIHLPTDATQKLYLLMRYLVGPSS